MAVIICFVILTLFQYFFTLGGILKATGRNAFEHQAFSRDMSSHHIGRTFYTTSCVVTQNNTKTTVQRVSSSSQLFVTALAKRNETSKLWKIFAFPDKG